jgi:hypothetical protein
MMSRKRSWVYDYADDLGALYARNRIKTPLGLLSRTRDRNTSRASRTRCRSRCRSTTSPTPGYTATGVKLLTSAARATRRNRQAPDLTSALRTEDRTAGFGVVTTSKTLQIRKVCCIAQEAWDLTAKLLPNKRSVFPTKKPRICGAFLSGRPDSNRGPRRPERRALPGCATPRRSLKYPTSAAAGFASRGKHRREAIASSIPTRAGQHHLEHDNPHPTPATPEHPHR